MENACCQEKTLTFRLEDRERALAGVRLAAHVDLPRDHLGFHYQDGEWRLQLDRPRLWRLEYLLELRHRDGRTELVPDPANPRRVGGAFGDKSVLECPDYREPDWLGKPAGPGEWRELAIPAPALKAMIDARVWSPAAPTDRVLVAHDGPEYDRLAGLGHYSATADVPAHHLVLLPPGERNEWYSANPGYAWALATEILPRVSAALGRTGPVVGIGASLGGLAMLHAHRRHPDAFAGLFLQSGSFFQPRFDRHESGFQRYLRIVRFVGKVSRGADRPVPVPTMLTCGLVEENRHNNREMARILARQGYPVALAEAPDGHNYTAWRDMFDPHLTGLLRTVWGEHA
jgi:enterochelin esterase family protein